MTAHEQLHLQVSYTKPGDAWSVSIPGDAIASLLQPFDGRKRAFLVQLLNEYSKAMAAGAVGVSVRATQIWAKKDEGFAEAVRYCHDAGLVSVIESELYRRALAGPADRGPVRALELIIKAAIPATARRVKP